MNTHCGVHVETIQHFFFACRRVANACELLQEKLSEASGRRLDTDEIMRPTLERIGARRKTMTLKISVNYISLINETNERIDIDKLNFNFDVGV